MDIKTAQLLHKIMEYDYDIRIMEDYSGRCMYGKGTTALTGDFRMADVLSSVLNAVATGCLFEEDFEDIGDQFDFRQDNMGLGIVIY
jgi:hypothetical protein